MSYSNKRWMLFVDGEGFTIRAQKIAEEKGLCIDGYKRYMKDTYFWMEGMIFSTFFKANYNEKWPFEEDAIRQYFYTTVVGDAKEILETKRKLRIMQFEPVVFNKKKKDDKSKAVDITLASHMLSHAFRNNYDAAVLVAGDGDYVPLVEEVKRLGKMVWLFFFSKPYGLNENLYLACDMFKPMEKWLITTLEKLQTSEKT